jgi:NAD(P)-dependent dehydrogenase (short-subunit alcohol dehydrogenase family)
MPPEQTMARNVVVVIGAGSGIGKSVAHRVAKEGAHVVCADLNAAQAQETADELSKIYGMGIGVAGTGISGCGASIGQSVDITNRDSLREMIHNILLAYGGIDNVIVTAGVFFTPDNTGHISDELWHKTFQINVFGGYTVADEIRRIWKEQALDGSLVLTTSVNAAVSKAGSIAYDASKAAANHMIRELAIELAPHVRVNGLAPATVVEGSSMFPRDRVIVSLTKYKIAFDESESTESLRSKLANFYAQRTLTKRPITPDDQAEVAYLISTKAFSKTTGQIFSVDGGLTEAFLR